MGILKYLPKHGAGKHDTTVEATANKDALSGYAALNASGSILAKGSSLYLIRGVSNYCYLIERTSGEAAYGFWRYAANYYLGFLMQDGAFRQLQTSLDKNVASGIAGLNAAAQLALAQIPTTLTGKDADTLDTKHAADFVAAADLPAHAALTTGVHGAGASTIATIANIATHAALTATHGVATIAGLADINTHSALTTGTHGAGASTIATIANIATHAALTATHGVATIAGTADITTHSALTTGTHGVGASTVASVANIATHAALAASVHGVSASGFEDKAGRDANSGYPILNASGELLVKGSGLRLTRDAGELTYIMDRATGEEPLQIYRSGVNDYLLVTWRGGSSYLILNAKDKNAASGVAGLEANAKLAAARFNSFTSAQQTITTAGALTLAHGLGAAPTLIQYSLVCQTAELGYAAGDVCNSEGAYLNGAAIWSDATNIYVRFSSVAKCYYLHNKTTGASGTVTNAYWALVVRAWVM